MSLTTRGVRRAPAPALRGDNDAVATAESRLVGRLRRLEPPAVVALVAIGVVLRFATTSALWLDEALSVNIASLSLGDIPDALRQDGHPPLYYFLLHGWMSVFGEGDVAVRALSGVFGVAALPLAWLAGRRLGGRQAAWIALVLTALSPFAVRYATEARMYALVTLLVFAGYLVVGSALERPSTGRLAGVVALSAALLYTHYWAMWLLGALILTLGWRAWRARRAGRPDDARAPVRLIGALVVGGLLFVPWAGVLLYQAAHTGTPWALPLRPTAIVSGTIADFGGGAAPESVLLGWGLVVCGILALFGRPLDHRRIELDVRTMAQVRPELALVALTLIAGTVTGYLGGSTYASRYAAVFFPLVIVVVAVGVTRLTGWVPRTALLGALVALSLVGGARGVFDQRTQAEEVASVITAEGRRGDVVAYCPDQLGPAGERALPAGFDQVTYPALATPGRVDWVDYEERNDAADPEAVAQRVLERVGAGRGLWVVFSTGYRTHEDSCVELVNAVLRERPGEAVLDAESEFFEPAGVYHFPPS